MRHNARSGALALALIATLAAASVRGDEVKRLDGSVVEGEIVSDDGDFVVIKHKLGEIKIAKKDIASYERKPLLDIAGELERIKTETRERLEALAKKADEGGKKAEAKQVADIAESVRHWGDKAAKAPAATPTPEVKTIDFAKVLEKHEALGRASGATQAQITKAREDHNKTLEGFYGFVDMKVQDVTKLAESGGFVVHGYASGHLLMFVLADKADAPKLLKIAKGTSITIGGWVKAEGSAEPRLSEPCLAR